MKQGVYDLRYFGFKIETWYDRKTRSWVSQLKDGHGSQVGNAEYDGVKSGIERSHEMLRARALAIQPRDCE